MKVHFPVPSEREQDRFELSGALHGERFVEALELHDVQSVSAPAGRALRSCARAGGRALPLVSTIFARAHDARVAPGEDA